MLKKVIGLGWVPEGCEKFAAACHLSAVVPSELMFPLMKLFWDHGGWCKDCGGKDQTKDFWRTKGAAGPPAFAREGACPLRDVMDRSKKGAAGQKKEPSAKAKKGSKTAKQAKASPKGKEKAVEEDDGDAEEEDDDSDDDANTQADASVDEASDDEGSVDPGLYVPQPRLRPPQPPQTAEREGTASREATPERDSRALLGRPPSFSPSTCSTSASPSRGGSRRRSPSSRRSTRPSKSPSRPRAVVPDEARAPSPVANPGPVPAPRLPLDDEYESVIAFIRDQGFNLAQIRVRMVAEHFAAAAPPQPAPAPALPPRAEPSSQPKVEQVDQQLVSTRGNRRTPAPATQSAAAAGRRNPPRSGRPVASGEVMVLSDSDDD